MKPILIQHNSCRYTEFNSCYKEFKPARGVLPPTLRGVFCLWPTTNYLAGLFFTIRAYILCYSNWWLATHARNVLVSQLPRVLWRHWPTSAPCHDAWLWNPTCWISPTHMYKHPIKPQPLASGQLLAIHKQNFNWSAHIYNFLPCVLALISNKNWYCWLNRALRYMTERTGHTRRGPSGIVADI